MDKLRTLDDFDELRARLLEAEGRYEEAASLRREALDGLEALGFRPD